MTLPRSIYRRNCADVQITGDASSGTARQAGHSQSSRKALLPVTQVGKQTPNSTQSISLHMLQWRDRLQLRDGDLGFVTARSTRTAATRAAEMMRHHWASAARCRRYM